MDIYTLEESISYDRKRTKQCFLSMSIKKTLGEEGAGRTFKNIKKPEFFNSGKKFFLNYNVIPDFQSSGCLLINL